jgi:hypothetical protein
MSRRIQLSIGVAVLGILAGCNAGRSPDIEITDISPGDLELPATFDRWDDAEATFTDTQLAWELAISAEPTTNNCPIQGEAVVWGWAHAPDESGFGDPATRLYLCDVATAATAKSAFEATPLESTLPDIDMSGFRPVPVETLGLMADEAKMACVRDAGDQECRAWAFLAVYGRFMVTATVEYSGGKGDLSDESFSALVASIDANIGRALDVAS